MAQKKQFKDLDLSNAFLFSAALENPETCRLVMELILGEPVGEVTVKPERTVLFSSDVRCVRLDIYANDGLNVGYNLEMQNQDEKNLPKRSRFHQAEMDLASLKPGQDFNDLKPSVIVFICTFDPFGKNLCRYTFEQRCLEEDFSLGDETRRIFLNTKGENEADVPGELVHFLHYVGNSTDQYVEQTEDAAIVRLHHQIKLLKKSRELEGLYMTVDEWVKQESRALAKELAPEMAKELAQEMAKDIAQGMAKDIAQEMAKDIAQGMAKDMAQGIAKDMAEDIAKDMIEQKACEVKAECTKQMLELVSGMLADGRADQISRLKEDEAFYQEMLKEYCL